MTELERLQAEVLIAKNHLSDMRVLLRQAEQQLRDYADRLTLSDKEREVLGGHDDGCIRIGEIRPILRRVFGDAA
jgi:hypothetical protein